VPEHAGPVDEMQFEDDEDMTDEKPDHGQEVKMVYGQIDRQTFRSPEEKYQDYD
jgi:hypothetical protein